MRALTLFEHCREARFIARPNRFTLVLERAGRRIEAYLPNTGRLEEYTVDGGVFFVVDAPTPKFACRAVAVLDGDFPVLIDTSKINALTAELIQAGALPGFERCSVAARERPFGGIRPDFTLIGPKGRTILLETKSCTLCRKGVALFPDAPSARAFRHLEMLSEYRAAIAFIIPHGGAARFMPNFHTDRRFAEAAMSLHAAEDPAGPRGAEHPRLAAYRVPLLDPVTADLDGVAEVPIDWERVRANCTDAGSYLLVLRNDRPRRLRVGRLGPVRFERGYYVYVGSALGSLDARIARHLRKRKKTFWHIDSVAPDPMPIEKTYPIRRADRIESALAAMVEALCDSAVEGFGASDSEERSHLFFFANPPHRLRAFVDIVLDFRAFAEEVDFRGETR